MILILALTAAFILQTPEMALPDGNGAWVVRVVTTGGFTGQGIGDFAISSEGRLLCRPVKVCPAQFKPGDFQLLVEAIVSGSLPVPSSPGASLCKDCILRTIQIIRRDSTGSLRVYTASWDDVTQERLPAQVIRVYDALLALRDDR